MSTLRAVVIGSGFGGLGAAVRLRAMGYQVQVLEALEQPGGRAAVWRREGFVFDAGPTVITAPYLFQELFELLGRDPSNYYQLLPVDPFYRVTFPDSPPFDYVGDEERLVEHIRAFEPRDVDGYRKLLAFSQEIYRVGYEQLGDVPFDSLIDMLRVAPQMIRLKSYRSVYSLVSSYLKDERLRKVFTFQPLLIGGNPFRTPGMYLLIHWLERKFGVWCAKGGTGALVRALVTLLGEVGVGVQYNTPVTEVEVQGGQVVGVRTEAGERIPCEVVVANGDPSTLYSKLVAPAHRRVNTDRRVARVRNSMSLFVGYIGAKGSWSTAHHSILLGKRYRGLIHDIFQRRVLPDDFSLYLHAPSRSDASLAPPGHEAFYVLSPVPNALSGIDWSTQAEPYFDTIIDHLDRTELPGLKQNIVVKHSIDPRVFAGRLASQDGAAFGPEPLMLQSAWFRYHNRSEDVRGLYLVGAGTHPGAGLPGVLSSAKVLDRIVPPPEHPLAVPPAS